MGILEQQNVVDTGFQPIRRLDRLPRYPIIAVLNVDLCCVVRFRILLYDDAVDGQALHRLQADREAS